MTNIEKIREAVIKANPEIVKLKFGCVVIFAGHKMVLGVDKYDIVTYVCRREGEQYESGGDFHINRIEEIIGRPIRLSDVLLAMEKANPSRQLLMSFTGRFYEYSSKIPLCQECSWNLKDDNLENQSEELKKFVADLL